jgi:hypothetical protein
MDEQGWGGVTMISDGVRLFARERVQFSSGRNRLKSYGASGIIGVDEAEVVLADSQFEAIFDSVERLGLRGGDDSPLHQVDEPAGTGEQLVLPTFGHGSSDAVLDERDCLPPWDPPCEDRHVHAPDGVTATPFGFGGTAWASRTFRI